MYLFQKASYSPCGAFLFRIKPIFALNACAEQQALVSTTYQVEDTFHTRSDTNVECLSLQYNPNKSYVCVLGRLAQCKNPTVTACLLKLRSEICKASKERVRTCKDYIIGREITTLLKITVDNVILEFCDSCDYFASRLLM